MVALLEILEVVAVIRPVHGPSSLHGAGVGSKDVVVESPVHYESVVTVAIYVIEVVIDLAWRIWGRGSPIVDVALIQ